MIPTPHVVMNDYIAILRSRGIPEVHFENYKKWLRYFYDFNTKYLDTDEKSEKVRLFLEKLRSKKQTSTQCHQAAHAVSLYFEMQKSELQPPVKSATDPGNELLMTSRNTSLILLLSARWRHQHKIRPSTRYCFSIAMH